MLILILIMILKNQKENYAGILWFAKIMNESLKLQLDKKL